MRKHPEVTEATQKAFIDAFCILSREKPIEKITIKDITLKAGYNRCTFYQYFKDVYDLLDHIENMVLSHIKENFQNNITQENFSASFLDAFTRIHLEQAAYFDLLLNSANRTRFADKLMTDVMPIFLERFHLPKEHPHAEYLASMYFATVVAAISRWIQEGRTLPLEDLSQLLGNVLTQGVMQEIGNCKM